MRLRGEILRTDGSDSVSEAEEAAVEDGAQLGRELAKILLTRAGRGFFDWR